MIENPKYLVLTRFEINGNLYASYIMFLADKEKALWLASFLNIGEYFETEVTVEEVVVVDGGTSFRKVG